MQRWLEVQSVRPRLLARRPLDRFSRRLGGAAAAVRDAGAAGGAAGRGEGLDRGDRCPPLELLAALVARRQPAIAYRVGETGPSTKVFMVSATGGWPPSFGQSVTLPIWSPDGKHLLIGSFHPTQPPTVPPWDWWACPADGGAPVKTGAYKCLHPAGATAHDGVARPSDRPTCRRAKSADCCRDRRSFSPPRPGPGSRRHRRRLAWRRRQCACRPARNPARYRWRDSA